MVKVLSFRLFQSFDSFTVLPVKRSSETGPLQVYITMYFGVLNCGNT